jgi:hypothetical protein
MSQNITTIEEDPKIAQARRCNKEQTAHMVLGFSKKV